MSDEWLRSLIEKHASRGVIVDTNLMLLYAVGWHSPKLIQRFKRTQQYTEDNYRLLCAFLSRFHRIVTTPNILTEVNSLSGQLPKEIAPLFRRSWKIQIAALEENHLPGIAVSQHSAFEQFGLTDAAIAIAAVQELLVLTDDLRLEHYLHSQGVDCVNFNHLRYYSA